ncbi:hypothetical protein R3P38DRAFT_2768060 [Favolaschia claudopus]|uniref:Uncharacterized protein n=1 Tax=Favolaschia claudopus TaxID=2862362 RepID=A0AAW0CWY9_9AGAR
MFSRATVNMKENLRREVRIPCSCPNLASGPWCGALREREGRKDSPIQASLPFLASVQPRNAKESICRPKLRKVALHTVTVRDAVGGSAARATLTYRTPTVHTQVLTYELWAPVDTHVAAKSWQSAACLLQNGSEAYNIWFVSPIQEDSDRPHWPGSSQAAVLQICIPRRIHQSDKNLAKSFVYGAGRTLYAAYIARKRPLGEMFRVLVPKTPMHAHNLKTVRKIFEAKIIGEAFSVAKFSWPRRLDYHDKIGQSAISEFPAPSQLSCEQLGELTDA